MPALIAYFLLARKAKREAWPIRLEFPTLVDDLEGVELKRPKSKGIEERS